MPNYKRKFSRIYDKEVDRIYRFVFVKVGTKETAEDLTAQVFSKGWKKFKTGQKIENPSAYLYSIARSEIADYYRKKDKLKLIFGQQGIDVVDPSASVEQNVQQKEQAKMSIDLLQKHLSGLKDDYQNVLLLRYVDEMSIKEIAKTTDKPKNTVKVLIHRALKELREQMEK